MSQWSWQLSIVFFSSIVFGFIFLGKSSGKYTLYLLSLSLSFVRRWVTQCLYFFSVFFCLFLSFSLLMPIWHAFCLPAIGQTRPFGVLPSGDSAIRPFGYPSHPIPPIHAFGYPSIHASIRIAPFFIQFIHPNASQPSCCVRLFAPSERLMRKCPVHSSLSYPTCVHPSCRLCKPSTLLVCTFVPWKRRPSIQSREARQ